MKPELVALDLSHAGAIHELAYRWERHWNYPMVTDLDEISRVFSSPGIDSARDTRGVWLDGQLVAYGSVSHSPSGVRQERAFVHGWVDPRFQGQGIGRRLLAWQIERAVERLRECDPTLPRYIRAYEMESIEPSHRLYRRLGLTPVRWFHEMIRGLDAVDVASPVELIPWTDVDTEEIRQVANAAFADHWGSTPRNRKEWDHMLEADSVRPGQSWVATANGSVVGFCLNAHFPQDEEVTGRLDGWIDYLGVLSDWRKQGIAAALIAASIDSFRRAGYTHAMLGVDSANPTGASGLYARLGFEKLHVTVTSEFEVPTIP